VNRSTQPQSGTADAPAFFSPQVFEARRFFLKLNPPKRVPLAVVSGGCEHCSPDYEIHRATFPFYSIEYVVRGSGILKLQNRKHVLQPGTVFSYGPGVRQDIVAAKVDPPVKYFVDFDGLQSKEILRQCHLASGGVTQIFPPNELQNLFDELIRCGQLGSPRNPELCVKLLECLVLKISSARAPLAGTEALSFTTYQRCRQHVEKNFQQLRSQHQFARECHVNAAYLCRLFQRYDHQSPYQLLMRLKMNLAAEWLQQPGALVKQIAERAGFKDQFHFSRAFKGVLGIAPDIFRRFR